MSPTIFDSVNNHLSLSVLFHTTTMASFGNQLSFFLLLVLLVLSPQIQAREGKVFSLFSHFRTIYNVKDPQPQLPMHKKGKAESPAPTPAPITAPSPAPFTITAPSPSPITITAPTPAPEPAAAAPVIGTTIPSGPAPQPEFFDSGVGYGLYGRDSGQYSSTKETPTTTTTTFENELLSEEINDNKSYKKGYPQTNFHNNYNNEEYTRNYNSEEYKSNGNNGYNKNYVEDSYTNTNKYNGKEYYTNNNYYGNGYERKRSEGMSDTRFMEDGKYYYNVNSESENYNNLNGYQSGRGSTENEGYYEKNQYPNEFDTMEEYERQQEAQGYTP